MRFFSIEKLPFFLYVTLLVLLPTQFGKHFWPSFAFVNGLRLDYLSPTLYVTDLVIGLLFIFSLFSGQIFLIRLSRTKVILTLFFFVFLIAGIIFSKNPLAGWYGMIKLLEMLFFTWYTFMVLGKTISYKTASLAILSGMLFESMLALVQLVLHASVGGIFYFFGERDFSMTTPGIANASIHGQLLLRPYGTLPHPNVLASFLLIGLVFTFGQWYLFSRKGKTAFLAISALSVLALLLTLSRITIMVALLVLGVAVFQYVYKKQLDQKIVIGAILGSILLVVLVYLSPLSSRFLSSSLTEESVVVREDLAANALWMLQTHPLFGVGLQNFYANLPASLVTRSYYTQMQPVHNMYLLVFAQGGIVVGLLFLFFLLKTFRHLLKGKMSQALALFMIVLFLGLFDHYFLTVQQGQLLFAFVIGYCYSFVLPKAKKRKTKYNKNL